jgi:hypothetical protein
MYLELSLACNHVQSPYTVQMHTVIIHTAPHTTAHLDCPTLRYMPPAHPCVPCRNETTVLALNGLGKVLRAHLSKQHTLKPCVPLPGCVFMCPVGTKPQCWPSMALGRCCEPTCPHMHPSLMLRILCAAWLCLCTCPAGTKPQCWPSTASGRCFRPTCPHVHPSQNRGCRVAVFVHSLQG